MRYIVFVLHPGYIISKNDGDEHFIQFHQLRRLYGLSPDECEDGRHAYYSRPEKLYVNLYPRYDGDYLEHINTVRRELESKYES